MVTFIKEAGLCGSGWWRRNLFKITFNWVRFFSVLFLPQLGVFILTSLFGCVGVCGPCHVHLEIEVCSSTVCLIPLTMLRYKCVTSFHCFESKLYFHVLNVSEIVLVLAFWWHSSYSGFFLVVHNYGSF